MGSTFPAALASLEDTVVQMPFPGCLLFVNLFFLRTELAGLKLLGS